MDDFEATVIRKLNSLQDAVNWGDTKIAELLKRLPPPAGMRKVATIVLNAQGVPTLMSGSQPIPLVNAANPAAATRALEVIDLTGGTTIPTVAVTAGNAALVALVPAAALSFNTWTFGVYPVDTATETNDAVTVTATLPDGNTLEFNYVISGTGETMAVDPSSSVGAWVGAPTVPATPV